MNSIPANLVTEEILSLFDFTKPTMPRAFNVLEGLTQGEIFVDDPALPTCAAVHEVTYGTLYLGGKLGARDLHALVDQIRETREVGIGCWLDDPLNDMLPPRPDYDGRALYFTERSKSVIDLQLPVGYRMELRDQELLKQSYDYETTLASLGTEENILKHTLGVDILYGDKVVCEAATGAPTQGWIEVGVMAEAAHRQRGLATIACARLIELCEAQGYATWWDCAKQNIASITLAHKLGYCNEREYRYVWWAKKGA